MNVATVMVDLPERSYPIHIGNGLLAEAGRLIQERGPFRRADGFRHIGRATVITDQNVARLYGDALGVSLLKAGIEYSLLAVPPGDSSKSLAIASQLFDEFAVGKHGRDEPVIALGGGMVGDLAGFVAATWLRGVPFVQCPTTLEAMIDAAVGGKTAVNHNAGKNLIGAFHQPRLVCIDPQCLDTLSDRDYRAALAESVKHGVIADVDFFVWHQTHAEAIRDRETNLLAELIERNCRIKAAVVVADEREHGLKSQVEDPPGRASSPTTGVGRAMLNFGHTIGHALEAASHYEMRHGEAVALGMIAELDLAVNCSGFPETDRRAVEELIARLGLPVKTPIAEENEILERLSMDKKAQGSKVRFIVPTGLATSGGPHRLGTAQWLDAPSREEIIQSIRRIEL